MYIADYFRRGGCGKWRAKRAETLEKKIETLVVQVKTKEGRLSGRCSNILKRLALLGEIRALEEEKEASASIVQSEQLEIKGMRVTLNDMKNQNRF